jgi:hypothetical protein
MRSPGEASGGGTVGEVVGKPFTRFASATVVGGMAAGALQRGER